MVETEAHHGPHSKYVHGTMRPPECHEDIATRTVRPDLEVTQDRLPDLVLQRITLIVAALGTFDTDSLFTPIDIGQLQTRDLATAQRIDGAQQQNRVSAQRENGRTSLPFGDALNAIGNDPIHFTGKERDPESGLDYFGARHYSSNMGRFMSPDWASSPTAVLYAIYTNPQSLNLYNYMRNSPLAGNDPDGHCCESDFNSFTPQHKIVHPAKNFDRNFASVLKGGFELGAVVVAGPEVLGAAGEATTNFEAVKVGLATLGVTGTTVNGTTDVVGGATNVDTGSATDAVTSVTNPVAAGAAIATKSLSAGSNTADAMTVGKAAAAVASGKVVGNAPEVVSSVGGAIAATKGAVQAAKSLFTTPGPPPPPKPPSTPGCSVKGAC